MIINKRCIDILSLLHSTDEYNIDDLSQKFNVHTRTIRYDIENINFILKNYNLNNIEKNSDGRLILNLKMFDLNNLIQYFGGISSESRKDFIKIKLLSSKHINLTNKTKILDTSRSTLKTDLEEIKSEFLKNNISITSLPSKGIFLEGNENTIRNILSKLIFKLLDTDFNALPTSLKELLEEFLGSFCHSTLKESFNFQSVRVFNEVFSIIAANRTRDSVLGIKTVLSSNFLLNFPISEREEELIKKVIFRKKKKEILKIEDEIQILLDRFNVMLKTKISFDSTVIETMAKDILYNENLNIESYLKNSTLYKDFSEIFSCNPNIFKNINNIFYIFYQHIKKKPLILPELKVLLVCDSTEFIKNILKENLLRNFNFSGVDFMPTYIFEIFGFEKDYDLILSCENISETLNIPTFKINKILKSRDKIELFYFILKTYSSLKE
ncbi:MAG: HTH domain-containing protein [Cetobacterium sp.]|uniref:HTH domain-containing protein n=1 Tax=Cetobacterium sp. TaxID=2071632 RepID=UPI002FCBEE7E